MNWLNKLRNQPENIRKKILWSVVIIIGLIFFFFWLSIVEIRLKNFPKEKFFQDVGLPKFQEELKKAPSIEIPEINPEMSKEDLKNLEESLKGIEEKEK